MSTGRSFSVARAAITVPLFAVGVGCGIAVSWFEPPLYLLVPVLTFHLIGVLGAWVLAGRRAALRVVGAVLVAWGAAFLLWSLTYSGGYGVAVVNLALALLMLLPWIVVCFLLGARRPAASPRT